MDKLRVLGLHGGTIERLHLGLKQAYVSRHDGLEVRDALSYPLLSDDGLPIGRYAYRNLQGITTNPQHPKGWGPGPCTEYRLGNGEKIAVVAADVLDLWLAWQTYGQTDEDVVFISRSQWGEWPAEWRSGQHWSSFGQVLLIDGDGAADFIAEIAPLTVREILQIRTPAPFQSFTDMVRSFQAPPWDTLLGSARPIQLVIESEEPGRQPVDLGIFEAAPIDVSGGFACGNLYYPVAVEQRHVDDRLGKIVHRYRTLVVRSDGALLSAEPLPAPCGTASSERVLALSDGTRIKGLPAASTSGTWSFGSIQQFVEWRKRRGPRPFRELSDLLETLEKHLRSRVWLPDERAYALAATFVAMTHVHQIFDALPILLAVGPAGSGKSELGEAIARVAINGTLAGQLRAAGMVRLLDQTHGLLVLDDMDGTGAASVDGDSEIAQALKSGYKRSTARKPVADRAGRIRIVDYFGPKMITRTKLPKPILGSRMIAIHTAPALGAHAFNCAGLTEEKLDALRDELHCWALASANHVLACYQELREHHKCRWDEITSPLLAISDSAGSDFFFRVKAYIDCDSSRCSHREL